LRLLLDTHALIWWLAGDQQLSAIARGAILDAENVVFVSAATGWEIATKFRIGRLPGAALLAADVAGFVRAQGFDELPIMLRHGQVAGNLPRIHKNPVDRLLVAQAITDDMTLVSKDTILRAYGVALLW